jgi:hypothetical protein
MRRPGDDNMTDQIRAKLDGYRPEYKPEAWIKLDRRLTAYSKAKGSSSFKSWTIGFVSGILISVGISYFLFIDKNLQDSNQTLIQEINLLKNKIGKLKESQNKFNNYNNSYKSKKIASNNIVNIPSVSKIQFQELDFSQSTNGNHNKYLVTDKSISKIEPYNIVIDQKDTSTIDTILVSKYTMSNKIVEKNTKKRKHHFKWPSFNFKSDNEMYKNFVGPNKIYINYNPSLEMGDFQDKNGISHSAGIGLSGQISNNFKVSIGLNLGQYLWGNELLYGHSENIVQDTLIVTQWITDSTINYSGNVQYIDLPFNFSFKLLEVNKSSLYIQAGILARFYLKEKYIKDLTVNENIQSFQSKYNAFDNYHIPAKLNFGFQYNYSFSERWNLQVAPKYSFSLQNLGGNKIKNSSWGLSIGLSYKFRKDK